MHSLSQSHRHRSSSSSSSDSRSNSDSDVKNTGWSTCVLQQPFESHGSRPDRIVRTSGDHSTDDAPTAAASAAEVSSDGDTVTTTPMPFPVELWSPQTGLCYRIGGSVQQDPTAWAAVCDVLDSADPVDMHFSQCRLHERVYAFEVRESVTRTVRIGPPGSRYSKPLCEACCAARSGSLDALDNGTNNTSVCRHVVWVLDHLARQGLDAGASINAATNAAAVASAAAAVAAAAAAAAPRLGTHTNAIVPLTMGPNGYAIELGNPYDMLDSIPLEMLASRLHCRIAPPAGESTIAVDHRRIAEIKRMLSEVSDWKRWARYDERVILQPNPSASPRASSATTAFSFSNSDNGIGNPVCRGNLDATLFRMLYANPAFFAYFATQLDASRHTMNAIAAAQRRHADDNRRRKKKGLKRRTNAGLGVLGVETGSLVSGAWDNGKI